MSSSEAIHEGPFHGLLRVRLIALIDIHGFSLSSLSTAMGRNHTFLGRKLEPPKSGEVRPLTTEDVDAILEKLGEPPARLLDHVIGPADRALLGFIAAAGPGAWVNVADARKFMRGVEDCLGRMFPQGLIQRSGISADQPHGKLCLTSEGFRIFNGVGPSGSGVAAS